MGEPLRRRETGDPEEPVRGPSVRRPAQRRRTLRARIAAQPATWALALLGALALFLLVQMVGAVLGVRVALALFGPEFVLSSDPVTSSNFMSVVMVVSQLLAMAVFFLIWRRMRPVAAASRAARPHPATRRATAQRAAGILLLSVGLQMAVSIALTLLLPLFPAVDQEYSELMADYSAGAFALLSFVSTVILAPLLEEVCCRGIMFECASRMLSARQRARVIGRRADCRVRCAGCDGEDLQGDGVAPSSAVLTRWQLIIACLIQALAFGLLHMNVVQSSYAFIMGAVAGLVYCRTGSLAWPILLHLGINASSYLVDLINWLSVFLGPAAADILFVALVLAIPVGWGLFSRVTPPAGYALRDGD